jgi:hypothetical protein
VALPQDPGPTRSPQRGVGFYLRAITLALIVPALLVLAWAAFGLQGYQEHADAQVFQTWPAGVASLLLATALVWVAVRPSRELQPALVGLALLLFAVSWGDFFAGI